MHLSFSQGHTEEKKKEGDAALTGIQYEFINLLLKSVGVTITEIQDVVFKYRFIHIFHEFASKCAIFFNLN